MADSGYARAGLVVKNRAAGYVGTVGGSLFNGPYYDVSNAFAAGGLYSTVEDVHRWSRSFDSGSLARPDSLAAMFRPEKRNYAYGWVVTTLMGRRVAYHDGGSIDGFATAVARFPDDGVHIVVLSNVRGTPAMAIVRDLAAVTFARA